MPILVPIPWQPSYFLTPDTPAYLIAASSRLGTQLRVTDAWRSYAEQKALYDYYLADKVNHPVASNPDNGQRNHMRGAAFDLVRVDKATQDSCRAVGLLRDPDESWHWNNPRWASMPIIPTNTNTGAASTSVTPIKSEDEDMPIYEAFKVVGGNGTIYLSVNRAGYWALSGQDWSDYQYWFSNNKIPVPAVQSVKNPSAFGPNLSSLR